MSAVRRPLSDFIQALRAVEIEVSPAESIDAHNALACVGYGDRAMMRDALCAALAKTQEEVRRFDECFDRFFAREKPSVKPQGGEGAAADKAAPPLAQMLMAGDSDAIAMEMEAAARRAEINRIRHNSQRSVLQARLLREMGLAELDRYIAQMNEGGGDGKRDLPGNGLAQARERLVNDARQFVERQRDLYARETGRQMREERLSETPLIKIAPEDMRVMKQLTKRIANRLASRYGRRRLRARRGQLDARRTLRRSMAHGGVPFETVWKRKAVTRPKIVVICDVSRSVASAAQFLLLMLYSLNEVVDRLDAYAFSNRLERISDIMDEKDVDEAIEATLMRVGFRSTDYGRMLENFTDKHIADVDRTTTIIILGDARTNFADPRLDLMRVLEARSRGVIWLNPEEEDTWNVGDSEMRNYARFCQSAKSCATLSQLEGIIDDVISAYR
ncbi:MAG: VWA domain-containing protein [Hyphomonadaceae bacterium]